MKSRRSVETGNHQTSQESAVQQQHGKRRIRSNCGLHRLTLEVLFP